MTPVDAPEQLETARRDFVEQFSAVWANGGAARIEGRVLAYLIVAEGPAVSTAELMSALGASAGAVSTSTRHLVEIGFVQRRHVPGERSYHFAVEDDVWGTWLAGERRYLDRHRDVFDRTLAALEASGEPLDGPRRRLSNGSHYMAWLAGYHREMLADWERYKAEHLDGADPTAPGGRP